MPSSITVVSTALNAERWASRCILSVRRQTARPTAHIYLDAASDDRTARAAAIAAHGDDRTIIVRQSERRRQMDNWREIIGRLPADEIVAIVDGDDWLTTDHALARIRDEYDEHGAWVTFGQFIWADGSLGCASPYSDYIVDKNAFRLDAWRATHLKTFRAGLFQAIDPARLYEPDGSDILGCGDQAFMLALLEMAGRRAHFIPNVLYLFNSDVSQEARFTDEERRTSRHHLRSVRSQPPCPRFEQLPWT